MHASAFYARSRLSRTRILQFSRQRRRRALHKRKTPDVRGKAAPAAPRLLYPPRVYTFFHLVDSGKKGVGFQPYCKYERGEERVRDGKTRVTFVRVVVCFWISVLYVYVCVMTMGCVHLWESWFSINIVRAFGQMFLSYHVFVYITGVCQCKHFRIRDPFYFQVAPLYYSRSFFLPQQLASARVPGWWSNWILHSVGQPIIIRYLYLSLSISHYLYVEVLYM